MITPEDICRHRDFMIDVCRKFGANGYAEDIVHDVIIKILEKGQSGDGLDFLEYSGEVNTYYLYTLCRNATVDIHRRSKKEKDLLRLDLSDDSLEEKQRIEMSIKCLGDLKKANWYNFEILYLYFFKQKSMSEIQRETGISIYSIRNTLNNGKEFIRSGVERLEKRGAEIESAEIPVSEIDKGKEKAGPKRKARA